MIVEVRAMTVQVNGKPMDLPAESTVARLVEILRLGQTRVAVERNKELVVRKQWESTRLTEGDRIEVVTFVGGG
jgi:sulfur carrier protein